MKRDGEKRKRYGKEERGGEGRDADINDINDQCRYVQNEHFGNVTGLLRLIFPFLAITTIHEHVFHEIYLYMLYWYFSTSNIKIQSFN